MSNKSFTICSCRGLVHLLWMFALGSLAGYSAISDLKRLMLACVSAVAVLGILHLTLGIDFAPPRGVLLMHHFLSVVALRSLRL